MLELTEMKLNSDDEFRQRKVEVQYQVTHNVGELRTTLRVPLAVTYDLIQGTATGKLELGDLEAENLAGIMAKAATWCDRIAAALRNVTAIPGDFPSFKRKYFDLAEQPQWVHVLYNNLLQELRAVEGNYNDVLERMTAEHNPLINLGAFNVARTIVENERENEL